MDVRFKDCTLHEALAVLEDDESLEPLSVFIEPPDPSILTDEDSADEDVGGLVNNLTGRQLNADCEVVLDPRSSHRDGISAEDTEYSAESFPSSSVITVRGRGLTRGRRTRGNRRGGRSSRSRGKGAKQTTLVTDSSTSCSSSEDSADETEPTASKKSKVSRTWLHEDLQQSEAIFPDGDYSSFRDKTPIQMVELFLDEKFYTLLAEESRKYAAFLNCPDPKITLDEIIVFIGILLNSGYNTVPSKAHYWDQHSDMRNHLVYNSMRRDRFKTIMRFIHCGDNTQMNPADKMWKLRPLIDVLKGNFRKYYVPSAHLNYDESMIEYFGKHGCKQFIRGKPIRFGFKNWCLNTPFGYLVDFEIYQGKSVNENSRYDKEFGKAASPLVKMIDDMPSHVQAMPMSFYFDNLFTGFQLLGELKRRGYNGTGTVRENRLPKDTPLVTKHNMQKEPRGCYKYIKCKEDEVIVVRWKDNSVVTGMSTVHGVEPLTNVGRYSATEKKKVQVPRPALFTSYNKYMGGTDLMDQNINTYRISIRGKKWWWPIFTYLIDAAVCNAWVLSRRCGNSISQLDFRRQIVQTYLMRYQTIPRGGGRPGVSRSSASQHRISDDIRFDGMNHLLVPTQDGKRRRCALESCKSQTRTECRKCGVGLCVACNFQFHT